MGEFLIEEASGITVTATPHFEGKFLVVRRSLSDAALPGYWAFPGGRVHYELLDEVSDGLTKPRARAETLTAAAAREVEEETGLVAISAFYVDSYDSLGKRAAAHFCLDVENAEVKLEAAELIDFRWVETIEDMKALNPRIPGLDNHLSRILSELSGRFTGPFRSFAQLDLTAEKYLNH